MSFKPILNFNNKLKRPSLTEEDTLFGCVVAQHGHRKNFRTKIDELKEQYYADYQDFSPENLMAQHRYDLEIYDRNGKLAEVMPLEAGPAAGTLRILRNEATFSYISNLDAFLNGEKQICVKCGGPLTKPGILTESQVVQEGKCK